jgi:hypothetical protein
MTSFRGTLSIRGESIAGAGEYEFLENSWEGEFIPDEGHAYFVIPLNGPYELILNDGRRGMILVTSYHTYHEDHVVARFDGVDASGPV